MGTPSAHELRSLTADPDFRAAFAAVYAGRHQPDDVLAWLAAGGDHSVEDGTRLAGLRRAVYSRPDGRVGSDIAQEELELLEGRIGQDRHDSDLAIGRAVAELEYRARTGDRDDAVGDPVAQVRRAATAPPPPRMPPRLPRVGLVAAAAIAVLVIGLGSGAAPTVRTAQPSQEAPLAALPALPAGFSVARSLGPVDEWDLYSATDPEDRVCLIASRGTEVVGTTCATPVALRDHGIAVVLLPSGTGGPGRGGNQRPVRVSWRGTGALKVER